MDNTKLYMSMLGFYMEEDYIYSANYEYNCFFRINRKDNYKVEYIGVFDGFKNRLGWKIRAIEKYNDRLYFFSRVTYEVCSYDLKKRKFEYYDRINNNCMLKHDVVVRAAVRVGNEVWLLDEAVCDEIVTFSMETGKYEVKKLDISESENNLLDRSIKKCVLEETVVLNNIIVRCATGTNKIILIDTVNNNIRIHNIPMEIQLFGLTCDCNYLFFSDMENKKIFKCECDGFKVCEIVDISKLELPSRHIRVAYSLMGKYVLIPGLSDEVIYMEKDNNFSFCKINRIHDKKNRASFISYKMEKDGLYMFPYSSDSIVCYDSNKNEYITYPIKISKKDYQKCMNDNYNIISESIISLREYMDYIVHTNDGRCVDNDNMRKSYINKEIFRSVL